MEKLVIEGGRRLHGRVSVNGAKNAALPIMAACILTHGISRIKGIPNITDVRLMVDLLRRLGLTVERLKDGTLELAVTSPGEVVAPNELVKEMRASICVLGPLLGRWGRAEVARPGGCVIGYRGIDLHLKGLEALGAKIIQDKGYIIAEGSDLFGRELHLAGSFGPTVLGTANVMMAACLAKGTTVIKSAACEPEIQDLAHFLNLAGAKITGIGTSCLVIEGVEELSGVEYEIIPDRIEVGSFMVASAITRGNILIENVRMEHLGATIEKLREIGVIVEEEEKGCRVKGTDELKATCIGTLPYPGFATDMQPQFTSLLSIAQGTSVITEKVFPDRATHIAELSRMGASITKEGPNIIIKGVQNLSGAEVTATDLRASASLILAGLVARGTTEIRGVHHLDRGYEHLEERLAQLGAKIKRVLDQPLLHMPKPVDMMT
ncbi:MAG TPA: UDP-N-acetylglucosamine 1-carboxyvinyltransferase [Candidatus Hypogeohydataceae bacterium YC41]